jgi:gliding motility-associated protein GldM
MSIPKEPRQIMINLMYLVLTAMLALNISAEILNAFKTINDSIQKSNTNIVGNNDNMYRSLDALEQTREQHDRVKPYNDKAKQVKAQADATVAYLYSLQQRMIKEGGGLNKEGHIEKEGDIDLATRFFVEGEKTSKSGGDELKNKLLGFRNFALNIIPNDTARKGLADQIPLNVVNPPKSENNPDGDWAHANFFHMPTVAAVTMFSKFINDVRNTENMVVQELMNESDVGIIKFDAIQAIAVPKTSYALTGQKVEAQIVLAAYNRTVNPTVSASSGRITKVENGVAYWESTASGAGPQKVHGTLSISFNGNVQSKAWDFQYVVGSEGGSLQLDKMNVFYVGLDNPVTISAAGYSMEDASLSIPGATVTSTGQLGHYMVRVTQPNTTLVGTVNAKTQAGAIKSLATLNIRVKSIPDPEAQIGGKHGGLMQAGAFKAQTGISAELKDFLFEGVRYQVVSYTMSMKPKKSPDVTTPITVPGAYFEANPQVKSMIGTVRTGDKVFFDDIIAVGPDGKRRNLGTLTFTML